MNRVPLLAAAAAIALAANCSVARGQRTPPPPPPSEASLLEVVRSNADLYKKMEACRMLGQVGSKTAVPALAGLLTDPQLHDRARYALEQIPDPSVLPALRGAVPALKGRELVGTIMSIGVLASRIKSDTGDSKLIAPFVKDPDPQIAIAASYSLGKIGTPAAARAIQSALANASDSLKPVLWDASLRAAATLTDRGQTRDAAAICDRLLASDAPVEVRAGAARGSVLARKAAAGPQIARLLNDKEAAIFTIGVELTHDVPGEATTRAVASALPKLPADRQPAVVAALGSRGDRGALPAVRAAANGGDPAVRVAAYSALAALGDVESLPLMLKAAASGSESAAARAALVRLNGTGVEESLMRSAAGADEAASLVAIEVLARRQSIAALPSLFQVAREKSGATRLAAWKALGDISTSQEVPALLDGIAGAKDSEEVETLEQAIIKTCARSDDPGACADRVAGRMTAGTPQTKASLLRVLTAVGGPKALQTIRSAASDGDAGVRDTAVRALCNWPGQEVEPDLMAIAKSSDNPSHKLLAVRGYLRLAGDESLPASRKLAMCSEIWPLITRDDEKRQWIGAVGSTSLPRTFTMLGSLVDDGAVGDEACAAISTAATKVLRGPDAGSADTKSRLPELTALLEKCRQKTSDDKVKNDLQALIARAKQLQG